MPNPFPSIINSLVPESQASLLNGILWGIVPKFDQSLYQALIDTGTLHIVALSGTNISILISLAAITTLPLGRKASSIFTLCLIVVFVLLVGPSPSVVRAAIMGSLSLFAVYFGRRSWGMLSLFLTALTMLLFDSSLVKNISFQLSFLATFGLILAVRRGERYIRGGPLQKLISLLRENLRLTLYAQLFTLPVIFLRFHRVSLISPLANLLVGWTIQPIMVFGLIAAGLGLLWLPLGILPAWMAWVPLTYLISVIQLLAKIPGASVEF